MKEGLQNTGVVAGVVLIVWLAITLVIGAVGGFIDTPAKGRWCRFSPTYRAAYWLAETPKEQ